MIYYPSPKEKAESKKLQSTAKQYKEENHKKS